MCVILKNKNNKLDFLFEFLTTSDAFPVLSTFLHPLSALNPSEGDCDWRSSGAPKRTGRAEY